MLWSLTTLHLLANGDTNPIVPIVVIGIFMLIWGSAAIAGIKAAAKKHHTPPRPQPPRLPPTRATVRTPPPLPGIPRPFPPRPLPRSPLSASGAPLPPLRTKTRGQPMKAPPLPLPAAKPAPRTRQVGTNPTPTTRPAAPAPTQPSTRSKIATWLTPQTLRSQFILTEALRPPAALRKDPL